MIGRFDHGIYIVLFIQNRGPKIHSELFVLEGNSYVFEYPKDSRLISWICSDEDCVIFCPKQTPAASGFQTWQLEIPYKCTLKCPKHLLYQCGVFHYHVWLPEGIFSIRHDVLNQLGVSTERPLKLRVWFGLLWKSSHELWSILMVNNH